MFPVFYLYSSIDLLQLYVLLLFHTISNHQLGYLIFDAQVFDAYCSALG